MSIGGKFFKGNSSSAFQALQRQGGGGVEVIKCYQHALFFEPSPLCMERSIPRDFLRDDVYAVAWSVCKEGMHRDHKTSHFVVSDVTIFPSKVPKETSSQIRHQAKSATYVR